MRLHGDTDKMVKGLHLISISFSLGDTSKCFHIQISIHPLAHIPAVSEAAMQAALAQGK